MVVDKLSVRQRFDLEKSRLIDARLVKQHQLRVLFWECTLRCNLHCRHCGSDCRKSSVVNDMPLNDFLQVLDNIKKECDAHDVFVILTGGEPLVRADLAQCGKAIYDKGFPWGIVTNGLELTEKLYVELLDAGMHSMTVSLDGLNDNHVWMRGHKDSFKNAVHAISLLVQTPGFVFDVVTCVNRRNYGELSALRDLLIQLKVKSWRLFTVFPVGRAANDADLQLTGAEFSGLFEFIKDTRKQGVIHASYGCEGFLGSYEKEVRDRNYECLAGVQVGSVLADGSISACPSIRANYVQGNIYQDDFMEVWNGKFKPYRDRQWMKKGICADCEFFRYCKGNGMHLRNDAGDLLFCHFQRLKNDQ